MGQSICWIKCKKTDNSLKFSVNLDELNLIGKPVYLAYYHVYQNERGKDEPHFDVVQYWNKQFRDSFLVNSYIEENPVHDFMNILSKPKKELKQIEKTKKIKAEYEDEDKDLIFEIPESDYNRFSEDPMKNHVCVYKFNSQSIKKFELEFDHFLFFLNFKGGEPNPYDVGPVRIIY